MKEFMRKCKLEVTDEEIEEMFNEIDEDGSGTIDQDEFLNIISRKNISPNLEVETREVFKVLPFSQIFSSLLYTQAYITIILLWVKPVVYLYLLCFA